MVEANAAQVETRSSGIGEVVQTQRIVDLPLNGRNVTDLITLAGGAVNSGNIRASFFLNLPMISIAGQAASGEPFGTDYTLDGANHVNFMTGHDHADRVPGRGAGIQGGVQRPDGVARVGRRRSPS